MSLQDVSRPSGEDTSMNNGRGSAGRASNAQSAGLGNERGGVSLKARAAGIQHQHPGLTITESGIQMDRPGALGELRMMCRPERRLPTGTGSVSRRMPPGRGRLRHRTGDCRRVHPVYGSAVAIVHRGFDHATELCAWMLEEWAVGGERQRRDSNRRSADHRIVEACNGCETT